LRLVGYLAILGQTLIAGATFLVAKDAAGLFSAPRLIFFRIELSALLVLAAHLAIRRRLPAPLRTPRRRLALLALLGVTLNQGFFLTGIHYSTPLHASLLYAFTPVLVLVGAALWLRESLNGLKVLGVAVAVSGVLLVLTARGLDLSEGPLRGDLIILLAVLAWASYTLLGKRILRDEDTFTVIAWTFSFAALTLLPFAPFLLWGFDWAGPGPRGWSEVLFLAGITSGVAFTLYYVALKRLEAGRISVFANLQVPTTALLDWIVYGAVPGAQVAAGGLLVLAGVLGVQIARAGGALFRRPRRERGIARSGRTEHD
jgi:RarD protein